MAVPVTVKAPVEPVMLPNVTVRLVEAEAL